MLCQVCTAAWPSAGGDRLRNGVAVVARKLVVGGMLGTAVAVSAVLAAGPPALAMPAVAAAASPAASPLVWTAESLSNPPGAPSNSFQPVALSCSSATDCVGGGSYFVSAVNRSPVLLTLTGTKWTAAQAPQPADAATVGQSAAVGSVSCPSATSCFAGGNYRQSPGGNDGMLLALSGGTWSAVTAPLPANASANPDVTVGGMSCPSAKWCTAVGQYSDTAGDLYGLLLRWSHGAWTATAAPVPAGSAAVGSLDAVSCPSTARCFAGGLQQALGTGAQQPVLLTWSKHKWMVVHISLPANAAANPFATIAAVSCSTVKRCNAAGFYVDSAGNEQGVLLSWSGRKWTSQEAPLPADAATQPQVQLNAASCPTASSCIVGGTYVTASNTSVGLILSQTGTTWTATAAPATAYHLHGVSCLSATSCVALSWGISRPVALTGTGS
jgi:hypothetical protein